MMAKMFNLIAVLVSAKLIAVMEHNAHPYFYGYLFTYMSYVGWAILLVIAILIIKENKSDTVSTGD